MVDPRLQDVAVRAGVSMATASYVLRASPGARISSSTRARVLQAAEEIGYRLRTAHRIRGGVVLVAPEPAERIAPGLAAAVTQASWLRGLVTVLLPGNGATAREAAVAAREDGLRTVGVIRATGDGDDQLDGAASAAFAPTVLVDLTHRSTLTAGPVVVPDDRQAARQVAAALRSQGHHRIALVATDRRARLVALWCAGLADVLPGRVPVLEEKPPRAGGTSSRSGSLVEGHERPTAVICLVEATSAGVDQLARRLGTVPEDLTVVVRGGLRPDGPASESCVRVVLPVTELAQAAVGALDRRASSGHEEGSRPVTRVRFPDASLPAPSPRIASRAQPQASPARSPATWTTAPAAAGRVSTGP